MIIRSISPFTLILQRSAAIIASQFVPGLAATREKKGGRRSILYVHIHTPAAIGTTLMHARLPRNADAHTRRISREMIYSCRREIRLDAEEYCMAKSRCCICHSSIFINVIAGPRDSDTLTLHRYKLSGRLIKKRINNIIHRTSFVRYLN